MGQGVAGSQSREAVTVAHKGGHPQFAGSEGQGAACGGCEPPRAFHGQLRESGEL